MTPDDSDRLHASPSPEDSERWNSLLAALDLEELTEAFISRVSTVPGYDPSPFPLAEIRRTGRLTFETLIAGLRAGGLSDSTPEAQELGISRARAHVPATSLMTAIRQDFAVLWEFLTRVASPEDAQLIIRHTGIVLGMVEGFASQVQAAYVSERQRMRDEEASVRRGLVATLFQDPPPPPDRLSRVARELSIPEGALSVHAAAGDDIPALRVAVAELERAGAQVFSHHFGDALVVFCREEFLPGSRTAELHARFTSLRIGTTSASGPRELRRAATTARDLAHLFARSETGAMTWTRGWARLASNRFLAAGTPVLADVLERLARCSPAERIRLEEAAQSYLRTGSVAESAAELFCHRNTLSNRLRRFAELTGLDPTVPHEAARLVVGWA